MQISLWCFICLLGFLSVFLFWIVRRFFSLPRPMFLFFCFNLFTCYVCIVFYLFKFRMFTSVEITANFKSFNCHTLITIQKRESTRKNWKNFKIHRSSDVNSGEFRKMNVKKRLIYWLKWVQSWLFRSVVFLFLSGVFFFWKTVFFRSLLLGYFTLLVAI